MEPYPDRERLELLQSIQKLSASVKMLSKWLNETDISPEANDFEGSIKLTFQPTNFEIDALVGLYVSHPFGQGDTRLLKLDWDRAYSLANALRVRGFKIVKDEK
jgi:hypothetical protein